ncbi:hypothetical protein ACSDR0_50415 [Streptosporangium sp. G11]|uniref:hypothetical protein n=1 Tax=Streptosporangium sp. G11 TaxID=3436926 RepID=UPI003EBAC455
MAGQLPPPATTHRTRRRLDRARGNRRLRYIGTIKNDAWLHTRAAAALNLRTLISLGLTRTNGTWTIIPSGA